MRFPDNTTYYLTICMAAIAFALVFVGNMFFPLFGAVLIADKVRKCPCCKQPVNSRDYGKEVWEDDTK